MKALATRSIIFALATVALSAPVVATAAKPELSYQLVEGDNINALVREGPTAAHLLLRNGDSPRILVAFPAGNSGVGLWFDNVTTPAVWTLEEPPEPITLSDSQGRALHGVRARAAVQAPKLTIKQAVLSNVRFLRDYEAIGSFPAEVAVTGRVDENTVSFARDRVDGAAGYRLDVRVLSGRIDGSQLIAGADGRIGLEITAATGDRPLTGFNEGELLNASAGPDANARNALRFLSYREGFLAGSWRFNTYFGRDTLMSVRLLMPALQPAAVEAGLGSVLARLSPAGEVSHEDGLSEFAILEHRKSGGSGDRPTLDYGMVDDNLMLAPVAEEFLLRHAPRAEAESFLGRPIESLAQPGLTEAAGVALVKNLRFVLRETAAFADKPARHRLIGLKPGRMTGEWRDSHEGLGGGRYPYNVNAALAPAALEAADALFKSGLLDPYLSDIDRAELKKAARMARIWRRRAPDFFRVKTPVREAINEIQAYAQSLGVPSQVAVDSLDGRPLTFNALALDKNGAPIPILHSDEGFAFLFTKPSADELEVAVDSVMRPFPAGLMTDVGLLVANAALTGPATEAQFAPSAYHGAVVWSWQQALMAAGLERQLARTDLPKRTRSKLEAAQRKLWDVIEAGRALQISELWSWTYQDGRYQFAPFGAGQRDADESNAAQLWSTVYLAVRPPPN